jgi:uncharacterized protein YceK
MKLHIRKVVWVVCLFLFLGITVAILIVGCASIMHGTRQNIGISSSPTGASVTIDNVPHGITPVIADLKRKDNHIVKIEMKGYKPFEATLTRKVSGWVVGNILFGGLIGLAVDAITGGLYNLTPDQISATLLKEGVGFLYKEDSIYIMVVFKPDPGWRKIGALMPLSTE